MKKQTHKKVLSAKEKRNAVISESIPLLKKVIKKYGLTIVNAALSRINEYARALVDVQKAEKELAELKRRAEKGSY